MLHDEVALGHLLLDRAIHPIHYRGEQAADVVVVGSARVRQASQVIVHLLDLRVLVVEALEQFLPWTIKAGLFDLLDLIFVSVCESRG